MSIKKIGIIYRKEMLDLLRDRRTVVTSIVLPIILYPLIMIGFSSLLMRQESKMSQERMRIYVIDEANNVDSHLLRDSLLAVPNFEVHPPERPDVWPYHAGQIDASLRQRLDEEFYQAVVVIPRLHPDSLDGYPRYTVQVFYNSADELSTMAGERVEEVMQGAERTLVSRRLPPEEVEAGILEAVQMQRNSVASQKAMLGFLIGRLLPYFLILLTVSSGAVISSDLVAGEKERGTLETLLVSAANRNELVLGKFLTVVTFSLISVFMNIVSMFFSIRHLATQISAQQGTPLTLDQIPLLSFGLVLLTMLPLVMFLAGLLLSISTYSRNMREANTYLSPLMIVAMLMSLLTMLPGMEMNLGFAFIPILNIAMLFKEIMLNPATLNPLWVVITIGSTLLLDVLVLLLTVKLFNSEGTLFRVEEEKTLKFWGKNKRNVFAPGLAFVFFLAVLLLFYYVGGMWQSADIARGLVMTQLFIILLPPLLLVRIAKVDIKRELQFRPPKPRAIAPVLLMAPAAYVLATGTIQLVDLIWPIPAEYLNLLQQAVQLNNMSVWGVLLIMAVLPGLCEEFFTRGYLYRSFRQYGPWAAIVASGVLFGILHLDPFRLLPASLMGVYLGWLLWRSGSIWVPMLAHMLNNAAAVLLDRLLSGSALAQSLVTDKGFVWWVYVLAAILLGAMLYLYNRWNTPPDDQPGEADERVAF